MEHIHNGITVITSKGLIVCHNFKTHVLHKTVETTGVI